MLMRLFVSLVAFAVVLAAPVFAQEGEMQEMTPEQMAEMQAYMKAGALGPQHELMAKHVGTFDVAMKSWGDPEAPPMEQKGVAIRTLHMGGRIMHEEFQGLRITPNVYTTLGEVDAFSEEMERVIAKGLPA